VANMYRTPVPARPSNASPGVGEPAGHPGHPYVAGSTGTAPNPQLPEAKPGTVPKGGAATPKGSPPNPTK
jgi:hypothetical protein